MVLSAGLGGSGWFGPGRQGPAASGGVPGTGHLRGAGLFVWSGYHGDRVMSPGRCEGSGVELPVPGPDWT